MNVALEFTYGIGSRSGIGRYVNRLARAFPGPLGEEDAVALFFVDFFRAFSAGKVCPECARDRRFSFHPAPRLPARVYERAWNLPGIRRLFPIAPRDADLVHIASHAAVPVAKRQRMVCTIHDMAAWRFPGHPALAKDRRAIRLNALRADAILTDSRFSAGDIARYIPEAAGKIFPIHLGIDHETYRPASSSEIALMRKALGLERPYVLSVGLVHPNKNPVFLGRVLEALGDRDIELCLAGSPSFGYGGIVAEMKSLRCADRIRFLGHVDDRWLPALYSGAACYATASRSEGFGFTPPGGDGLRNAGGFLFRRIPP